jgi:hypothetical protein
MDARKILKTHGLKVAYFLDFGQLVAKPLRFTELRAKSRQHWA